MLKAKALAAYTCRQIFQCLVSQLLTAKTRINKMRKIGYLGLLGKVQAEALEMKRLTGDSFCHIL